MARRVLLVGEYLKGERPMTELRREFGTSRKSAYKWVGRYQAEGVAALHDKALPAAKAGIAATMVVSSGQSPHCPFS